MILEFPSGWSLYEWLYILEAENEDDLKSGILDLFTFNGKTERFQLTGNAFLLEDDRIYKVDGKWYFISQ